MVPRTPRIDTEKETDRIVSFIRQAVEGASAGGVVVGLSGGIDSSVVGALCVRALGKPKVLALLLPSDHTPTQDVKDALELAEAWGVKMEKVSISGIVEELRSSAKIKGTKIARANVEARIRMAILYYYANTLGFLVAGTGDRSESLLGYFCYDEETRVVTNEGPKGHDELKAGDIVYSYNTLTNELVETTVGSVHVFDYQGKMIWFKARGADLMVTPNHRMLIRTSSDLASSRVTFRKAEDCLRLKTVVVPLPSFWSGRGRASDTLQLSFKQRHIAKVVRIPIDEVLYMAGLFIGDGIPVKGKTVVPVVSNLSRVEYASMRRDSRGRFVPMPAELSAAKMKAYDTYETDFALPIPDKNTARAKLTAILDKHGIGYSLTPDLVRIPGKGIYDFFVQFGHGALNKHIPRWVFDYPSGLLAHVLRGLKDSDGSHAERSSVYFTSSHRLKDDFVELVIRLGRLPTVRVREPRISHYQGKEIRSGISFEISYGWVAHHSKMLKVSKARVLEYKGKVWCPSVPPYENILVERKGHYVFSGNTKWGDGGVDLLPVAHLYKTQVRELGRRLGLPEGVVNKPASPQLWPGHMASDEIPTDYDKLDVVLNRLFDLKMSPEDAATEAGVPVSVVERVLDMHRKTAHKRATPPSLA